MPNNLVIPHGIKVFFFKTDDNPIDSDVEKTIQFLAERCGWKEYYSHQTNISYNQGIALIELRYYIPDEDLK